jgi:hypothetical protein
MVSHAAKAKVGRASLALHPSHGNRAAIGASRLRSLPASPDRFRAGAPISNAA